MSPALRLVPLRDDHPRMERPVRTTPGPRDGPAVGSDTLVGGRDGRIAPRPPVTTLPPRLPVATPPGLGLYTGGRRRPRSWSSQLSPSTPPPRMITPMTPPLPPQSPPPLEPLEPALGYGAGTGRGRATPSDAPSALADSLEIGVSTIGDASISATAGVGAGAERTAGGRRDLVARGPGDSRGTGATSGADLGVFSSGLVDPSDAGISGDAAASFRSRARSGSGASAREADRVRARPTPVTLARTATRAMDFVTVFTGSSEEDVWGGA